MRNIDKKEVDFLITVNNKLWFSVEVKLSETIPSNNQIYFKDRLQIPFNYQVVRQQGVDVLKENIRVISAGKFLSGLI